MVKSSSDGPAIPASGSVTRRSDSVTEPRIAETGTADPLTQTREPAEPLRDPIGSAQPPSSLQEPGVGSILKGKYRLETQIGEGGMGVVYRAIDLDIVNSTSYVAIKLLKAELRTRVARTALADEVKLTQKLQSENIVDVYSFEQDANTAFMVMEFLPGRSLDKYIAEEYALGRPFKLAWPIIKGMGEGLKESHRHNIVHSDFKPSNVLITPGPTKVLDFGIARAVGRPLIGLTAAYASRDMILGMPCDRRDDVYSFGLVVYELLSGKHPFCDEKGDRMRATEAHAEGMRVARLRGLTGRQHAALKGALQFERSKRTANIEDVLEELERPPPPIWLWVAVCALLLVVVGMAAIGAYRRFGPQDSYNQFLDYYQRNCGAPMGGGADAETVKQLLDLGQQYLREGLKPLNPGLLSENARPLSSALSAFQEVHKADCTNASATRGVFKIVDAYKTEAQRLLAENQSKQALDITEMALRIWPSSVDLKTLERDSRARLAPPTAP
jgi:serine/threonine protein kinase